MSVSLGMVQGMGKQGLCGTGTWKAGSVCSEKELNLTHKNPLWKDPWGMEKPLSPLCVWSGLTLRDPCPGCGMLCLQSLWQ